MANGNRAAVDVVFFRIDAELVTAVETLAGKGFVQLPEADVINGEAETLEQFGHRIHRANTHFVGITASDGHAAIGAQRLQAQALGFLAVHQYAGAGAVRQLGGVTGGNKAAFLYLLATLEYGLQGLQAFQGGLRAVAFIFVQGHFHVGNFLGLFVHHFHDAGHGGDFVIKLAGFLGGSGAHL